MVRFLLPKRMLAILAVVLFWSELAQAQVLDAPVFNLPAPDSLTESPSWDWPQSRRAIFTPNMYGDVTGSRVLSYGRTIPGVPGLPGIPGSNRQISGLVQFEAEGFVSDAIYEGSRNSTNVIHGSNTTPPILFLGKVITLQDYQAVKAFPVAVAQFPASVGLLENTITTQDIQAQFAKPGEKAVFNSGSQAIQVISETEFYVVSLVYDLVTPGTPGTPGSPAEIVTIHMPNPAGGGLVGRTMVATGNSPLPRDRFIFDYDFIGNAPVILGGRDIYRCSTGFEKAFFDGLASVTVRMPFASTANPTTEDGLTNGSSTQFGNLYVMLKGLAYSGENVSISGGLAMSLPTAADTHLRIESEDLVRIRNESVLLTPYVAVLFTPSDRFFAQAWTAIEFDTRGNPVQLNSGTGLTTIGRLNEPALLQLDYQVGYWLVHPATTPGGLLRGLAPFAELHYNGVLSGYDQVTAGSVAIVDSQNTFRELNLSVGMTAQLYDNILLTGGVTAPLRSGNNQFGDYQVGIRLNWLFGGTATKRVAAVPNF
jgi:hypothetical protein